MATRVTTLSRRFLALTLFAALGACAPAFGATAYRIEASQGTFAATPGPATFATQGRLTARLLPTVGGPGQEWIMTAEHGQDHGYRIRNRSSGQCLHMYGANNAEFRADGNAARVGPCYVGFQHMKWRFYVGTPPRLVGPDSPYATTNAVSIMNLATRKCLGIAPTAAFVTGVLLRQYPCGGPDPRRRWRMRTVVVP